MDENYFEPAEDDQPAIDQPAFNPDNYVSKEAYNELNNKYAQLAPKMEVFDRLQNAFSGNPPQLSEAELKAQQTRDVIHTHARQALTPEMERLTQQMQALESNHLNNFARSKGFSNPRKLDNWTYNVLEELNDQALAGNATARQLASSLNQVVNSDQATTLHLTQFLEQNWDALNKHAGGFAIKPPAPQYSGGFGQQAAPQTAVNIQDLNKQLLDFQAKGDERSAAAVYKQIMQLKQW